MNSKSYKQQHGPLHLLWKRTLRKRARGQVMVIVALAMLLLIAIVGLAVDGGATYALRRKAQNASDGAALAGGRLMLKYYDQMVLANPDFDVPSSGSKEDAVRAAINEYIVRNGVVANTVKAYFVDRNKEIVTVSQGEDRGQGHCGSAPGLGRPCEVSENGEIPWQRGVIGVTLISTAKTDSMFAGAMGWDTLSSAARSTAFIFVNTTTGDINVQPIALFRDPNNYQEFEINQIYTLIEGENTQGGGNWGWVNWNGLSSSAQAIQALINCGFNPGTATYAAWVARCPGHPNVDGQGPTLHYESIPPEGTYLPSVIERRVPYLRYGPGMTGWWVPASSGAVNSNCNDFIQRVEQGGEFEYYPEGLREGATFYIPIFDKVHDVGGSTGLRYHLRQIVKFFIRIPTGNNDPDPDVSCRPRPMPTSTATCVGGVCPTSTPGGGGNQTHWFIRGKAKSFYNNVDSGELGDLRSSLNHTVALDR